MSDTDNELIGAFIGPPGKSSYQSWLAIGNTGTEAEFIESLRGPVGESSDTDITAKLALKVDKVAGKQLSTQDFTTTEKSKLAVVADGATANATDAALRDRALHTGTQPINTVSGLQASLDAKVAAVSGASLITDAQAAKLAGIATAATANSTDAVLKDRSNHTGTQPISSISGLQTAIDGKVSSVLGSGLITDAQANKLAGIAVAATANDTDANLKSRANHTGTQAVETIDGLQASLDGKVNVVSGKGLSTNDYTSAEKTKLSGLEGPMFRGTFISLSALTAGVSNPRAGNYADVDAQDADAIRYIWDVSDSRWISSGSSATALTAAQVKDLYESNPDTNAFTSTQKTKLDGIAPAATANSTDAVLKSRANHTGVQAISTVSGLQSAIDSKVTAVTGSSLITDAQSSKLAGIAAGATANATDSALRDRSTHTGTQAISTVDGLQPALDAKVTAVTGSSLITDAQSTKLAGISAGATANQTNAYLLDRANHTGTQEISTVNGLQTALDAKFDKTGTLPYSQISGAPSGSGAPQIPADWNQTNTASADYIKNKPTLTPAALGAATAAQGAKADTAVQPAALAAKPNINDSSTASSTDTYSITKILALLAKAGPIITNDADLASSYPASSNQYRTALIISGSTIKAQIISDGTDWLYTGDTSRKYSVAVTPGADMTIRRGMNISGAEYSENVLPGSDPTNYRLPTLTNFNDWKAQGANVVRIPLLLGRIVDVPGGNLTTAGMAALDNLQASADASGVPIILDFHDYAKRFVNGAVRQLGSTDYPLAGFYSDLRKVAAYVTGKSAFYAIDPINEPNGFSPLQNEFNYIARPFKQLMRDPQFRNTKPDLNWYLASPFSITPTGGSNGGGRMSWNANSAYIDAVRHRNGAGNDGPDVLVAGQTYTISFSYQSTATQGTNILYLGAGNYPKDGGTDLGNIPLPAAATKTRVSKTFTMPAGQTNFYYNFNMQGFTGIGFAEDWNLTEGATLQSFVPWSSDGTVAPLSTIMNAAIAAIRQGGFTGWILYEGDRASGLMDFANNYGFFPDIPWTDSLNRTMLSLHHYTDYSGAYTSAWTQDERDRIPGYIKTVSDWASAKSVQIQIGEWAPPNDASADSIKRRVDATTAADAYNAAGWHHTYWAAGVVPGSFTSITAVAPDSSKGNTTNLAIFQSHSANPPTITPTPTPSNAVTNDGDTMTNNGTAVTYN